MPDEDAIRRGPRIGDGEQAEDSELLRRYADQKSEEAFAELVRRHLDLVYAVALRQAGGDAHLAQDVAQTVFTALARKAAALAARPVLGGWLYRTTQFTAIDAVRSESRRRAREREAETMQTLSSHAGNEADWEKLRPTLDRAIGELSEDDRDAVVLRFFEGKSFADVGARLRLTENTARMRVGRALDKLHALLARRGVTSTTAALAVVLANQAGVAAPAGLAASVTAQALAGSGMAVGAASLIGFMSTGKITAGILGLAAIAAIGVAIHETNAAARNEQALADLRQQQSALLASLEARLAAETKRAQALDGDNAKLLQVIEGLKPGAGAREAEANTPVTRDVVDARYRHAQELMRNGDYAAALKEFLWCYDVGMMRVSGYQGIRATGLPNQVARLGQQYPAALDALRERRDQAQQRMLASANDSDAAGDFAALNRVLGDDGATIAFYDQLAPDDSRRRVLAGVAFDSLVGAQRYRDAMQAQSYVMMNTAFELNSQRSVPADAPNAERVRNAQRAYLVGATVTNVEVLAGSGDLAHARALAVQLLAYDSSDETKAALQQHLARAGHADLLAGAPQP